MSLLFSKGGYPLAIPDKSVLASSSPTPTFVGEIDSLRLSTLISLWWLTKSFDWAVDIAYSQTDPSSGDITAGAVAGMGTKIVRADFGPRFGAGALADMRSLPPSKRVFQSISGQASTRYPYPIGAYGANASYPVSDDPIANDIGSNTSSGPYSIPTPVGMGWFVYINGLTGTPGIYLKSTGVWASLFSLNTACAISGLFMNPFVDPDADTDAQMVVQTPGEDDVVLPIYGDSTSLLPGYSISGTITINFNNFWTP